jgi:hypothetical protein
MTDCYLVEKRLIDMRPTVFARSEFHGLARRPGAPYPLYTYSYSERHEHPLYLIKNYVGTAPIFCPNLSWIVDSEAAAALVGLPNVAFLQVRYDCVYAFAHSSDLASQGPIDRLSDASTAPSVEHDQALAKALGPRFEVIVEMANRIVERFSRDLVSVSVTTPNKARPLEIQVSRAILDEYPIFWSRGHVVRADVLERVRTFLDTDFFHVHPIEL